MKIPRYKIGDQVIYNNETYTISEYYCTYTKNENYYEDVLYRLKHACWHTEVVSEDKIRSYSEYIEFADRAIKLTKENKILSNYMYDVCCSAGSRVLTFKQRIGEIEPYTWHKYIYDENKSVDENLCLLLNAVKKVLLTVVDNEIEDITIDEVTNEQGF